MWIRLVAKATATPLRAASMIYARLFISDARVDGSLLKGNSMVR